MTSSLKPMQLISPSGPAPNPWKVAIVLDELNLPWELVLVTEFFKDVKKEPFTKLNPNGRVPAFVDPNRNNLIVWESGVSLLLSRPGSCEIKLLAVTSKDTRNRNR